MTGAPAYRDRLPAPTVPEGEVARAWLRPDPGRYWRDHAALAAAGAVAAVIVLVILGRTAILWSGIIGAVAAIGLRGLVVRRDVLAMTWLLTDRALIAPGGERFERADIIGTRVLMGDVQVTTRAGRRTLIKHQPDPRAVAAQIAGRA